MPSMFRVASGCSRSATTMRMWSLQIAGPNADGLALFGPVEHRPAFGPFLDQRSADPLHRLQASPTQRPHAPLGFVQARSPACGQRCLETA